MSRQGWPVWAWALLVVLVGCQPSGPPPCHVPGAPKPGTHGTADARPSPTLDGYHVRFGNRDWLVLRKLTHASPVLHGTAVVLAGKSGPELDLRTVDGQQLRLELQPMGCV